MGREIRRRKFHVLKEIFVEVVVEEEEKEEGGGWGGGEEEGRGFAAK